MSNFKLSQLQELKNITENQARESYIMVVATDDTGKLKNYRIRISELTKFVETDGVIQGTLTPDEVAQMITKAIKDHETISTTEETIIIPEKIIEVDTTLKDVTSVVQNLKDTTTEVKSTLDETTSKVETVESEVTGVKSTLDETTSKVETVESEVTVVKSTLDETTSKVETVESEVTVVKSTLDETTSKVETVESEVAEVKTVIVDTTTKVENNENAINDITKEIEILKTTTPTLDCVTGEHADEIFEECFIK